MATAVFGGSPRHHGRISNGGGSGVGGSGGGGNNIANHLSHASALQQSTPIISAALNQSNIIFPPTSFISSSSTSPASAAMPSGFSAAAIASASQQPQHHYHHQQQQQHYHHHSRQLQQQQQHQHHTPHRHSKRKSAVELLAESKPFYVKSEMVLDRQQQLSYRSGGVNIGCPPPPSCMMSPARSSIPHHRSNSSSTATTTTIVSGGTLPGRRCASSSSDMLQNKLRTLLNEADPLKDAKMAVSELIAKYKAESPNHTYDINKYASPKKLNQELSVLPDPNSDVSVFFPSAFLSPQSLPPHPASDDDIFSYGIDDTLMLTEDYQTISPPAEYAEDSSTKPNRSGSSSTRYSSYQRSYSHSQAVPVTDPEDPSPTYNINSHKSLPDLHSQISRHSPHSEALSCCSRGNRSNKSGSSFNRDSGGSSGHYTHRSEPCCKQKELMDGSRAANTAGPIGSDFRRDSGSSTQHSGNSYYAYGIPPVRYDCMECRAKIQNDANCLLNFTTPEVPEAFQDDYIETSRHRYYEECNAAQQKYYKNQLSPKQKHEHGSGGPEPPELSPPLGTFKRQRCFRVKQRASRYSSPSDRNCRSEDDRRPILRSKSDITDRYWHRSGAGGSIQFSDKTIMDKRQSAKTDSVAQLERFFDRLGLNEDTYDEFIAPKAMYDSDTESEHSSPVFFSDASTADSNRLPDSTEVAANAGAAVYRPSEPPSIVERNARIIKWLCNCRKLQLT